MKIMACGWSHHFMANRWEKVERVTDFIFLGSKIPEDSHCNHEIKGRLLLGRKPMTNLVKVKSVKVLVIQLCLTLCDPMDCNPPGSSVHANFQARILEWDVMPFSRGSSATRDQTQVFHLAGRFFTVWATREAQDSILKNRDLTLPTKVHIVKAMVFQ